MAQPEGRGPAASEEFETEAQWRSAGDRIQILLDASAAGGPGARERAESLVGELTDLYGAGLHRMITIAATADPALLHRFASDDLVASLMLVHNLHPHSIERRVADALDSVRPYLGSHGGDVTLLEILENQDEVVVRLAFAGSCKSCPSSAVTLELTVEDAVRAAAPEVSSIEVVAAQADSQQSLISPDSLLSRVRTRDGLGTAWHPVPDIASLESGEVGGFLVAGVTVLACRVGDELLAYRDRCGSCGQSMAGAMLHRRMGSKIGEAVLRCPQCHAHFDAVHAGVSVDDAADAHIHLEPLPLLVRDGVLSLAVFAETTGVA